VFYVLHKRSALFVTPFVTTYQAWSCSTFELVHEFDGLYTKATFFKHPGLALMTSFGVTSIAVSGHHIYCCGSDGSVQYIRKKCAAGVVL